VACWRTKAAISLERVKIEEKLLLTAYRNSPTLFQMVPSATPYGCPFLKKNWGFATELVLLISGTGKATDFKFGGYIYRANPNKSPLKIFKKMERGRIQGLPKLFWVTPIISGTDKATDFKFGWYIYRASQNKSPLKILEKGEHGCIQGLPKFLGYPLLSQEWVNFVGLFIGSIGTKVHEKCWE